MSVSASDFSSIMETGKGLLTCFLQQNYPESTPNFHKFSYSLVQLPAAWIAGFIMMRGCQMLILSFVALKKKCRPPCLEARPSRSSQETCNLPQSPFKEPGSFTYSFLHAISAGIIKFAFSLSLNFCFPGMPPNHSGA